MDGQELQEVIDARKAAISMARDAVFQGDSLAGMLSELERIAEPFYLGIDMDTDDSDMDVYP